MKSVYFFFLGGGGVLLLLTKQKPNCILFPLKRQKDTADLIRFFTFVDTVLNKERCTIIFVCGSVSGEGRYIYIFKCVKSYFP